jgi:hypothetical protein
MADHIRNVYFYQHTHTDIGYTHPQEEVAEQQAANIARALDFCRQTERRSPESRFAWTVETGWTLARFLGTRRRGRPRALCQVCPGRPRAGHCHVLPPDAAGIA